MSHVQRVGGGGGAGWSVYNVAPCLEGLRLGLKGPCMVRSNASWVILIWDPPWTEWLRDGHDWKHCFPATSLAGGKHVFITSNVQFIRSAGKMFQINIKSIYRFRVLVLKGTPKHCWLKFAYKKKCHAIVLFTKQGRFTGSIPVGHQKYHKLWMRKRHQGNLSALWIVLLGSRDLVYWL